MKSTSVSGLTTSSVSRGRLITFSVLAVILALIASADFVSHAADFVAPHRIHVIGHEIVAAWIIVAAASQLRASDYGVWLKEWRQMAQAVVVLDHNDANIYVEYVADQLHEPDYTAAIQAVWQAAVA